MAKRTTKTPGGQHSPAPTDGDYSRSAVKPDGIGAKLAGKLAGNVTAKSNLPPHVVVEARAGTGKTTTLVEGLKRLKGLQTSITPSQQQQAVWDALMLSKNAHTVGFVAFNKSIASELASRVPAGCEAKTMHGMGFGAVRKQFGGSIGVNEHRVTEIIARLLGYTETSKHEVDRQDNGDLSNGNNYCDVARGRRHEDAKKAKVVRDLRQLRKDHGPLLGVVQRLVGLCKMNLVVPPVDSDDEAAWEDFGGQVADLVSHYDIETEGVRMDRVYDLVPRVLTECLDVAKDRCIDFDDMVWLPVALDLPVFKFDLLLIDERQDLNKCQMQLALKAGHRIVAVGDEAQSIYGFAGADAQACKNFEAMLEATGRPVVKLPLTVTRRCGRAIVAEANKIVPDFQAHESNGEGSVSKAVFADEPANVVGQSWQYRQLVKDGDMILCRANAPLVSQCFKFIRMGRKAQIQGRDIGQGLISLVRKLAKDDPSVENLGAAIDDWRAKQVAKENARRNPSDTKLQAIDDKADCLTVLCEEADSVDVVVRKIEANFTDNKDAVGIKLSSIHKAKGLEAKRVFLLQPEGAEILPKWLVKKPMWEQQQARNLLYVAVTRAIEELIHVS